VGPGMESLVQATAAKIAAAPNDILKRIIERLITS